MVECGMQHVKLLALLRAPTTTSEHLRLLVRERERKSVRQKKGGGGVGRWERCFISVSSLSAEKIQGTCFLTPVSTFDSML